MHKSHVLGLIALTPLATSLGGAPEPSAAAPPAGTDAWVMFSKYLNNSPKIDEYGATEALRESDGNGLGHNDANVISQGGFIWFYQNNTVGSSPGSWDPLMSSPNQDVDIYISIQSPSAFAQATIADTPNIDPATDDLALYQNNTLLIQETPHTDCGSLPLPVWKFTIPANTGMGAAITRFIVEAPEEVPIACDQTVFESARFRIDCVDDVAPSNYNLRIGWHRQRVIVEDHTDTACSY